MCSCLYHLLQPELEVTAFYCQFLPVFLWFVGEKELFLHCFNTKFKIGSNGSKALHMNGGGGVGGKEKSECLYLRCVCFGCTGKDPQMTGFTGDDNNSSSSLMQDSDSLHRLKEKTKLAPASDVVSGITRRRRNSLQPPTPKRHGYVEEEEEKEEKQRVSSSLGVVVATDAVHRTSGLHQMNHLSLLSASKELRVLLDLQYLTQAFKILNSANQWSFNVFTLNKLTNGCSLFYMTLHLFHQYDFLRTFRLDVTRLMHCITLIESSYSFSNPYHNSVHAADVVQAMFCHLNEPQLAHCLKPLEKMVAILSAACHDVDHPGTNQGFLIATANPLCALYNNMSVLENHHWRSTIGILHESKLFQHLDRQTWQTMKHHIKTMILATDITRQTEILSTFQEHLDNQSLNLSSSEQHHNLLLQITLKCADISNPCRPWHLSKCWSELICEEFFKQGDCERSLGLPVTPFCDRHHSTMAKIQTGFMTHVAEPLFVVWNRFLATSKSRTLLDNLRYNRGQWESIASQEDNRSAASPAQITVQAVTERNSATSDQKTQVNGEQHLDSRCHTDPSLANKDLDSSGVGGSFQRRYSLPVGTNIRMSTDRRMSLPNGHPSVVSLLTRLTRLSEGLCTSEDACNTVKKCKIRHCSFEDIAREQTMCQYSRQLQMNHQRNPEYMENSWNLRKLCIGLNNSCSLQQETIDFCRNMSQANGNRLKNEAMPNGCQPDSEHSCRSSRWQVARKLSLIAPRDQQLMTVIVGRKRSRSLATSTLVCTLEKNWSTAAPQSFETNLNGLVPAEQMVDTSSGSKWMTWSHKKTKNHFCTTKMPPGPHNSDAYHCNPRGDGYCVEDMLPSAITAASSSVGISRAMPPVHLLSCQCPVLVTHHTNSHCCSAKGSCSSSIGSRKPTSVFTSSSTTEYAEVMPSLASDSSCIWINEM